MDTKKCAAHAQLWLKENFEQSKAGGQKGSASVPAARKHAERWGADWAPLDGTHHPWRPPSVTSGASKTLIGRFNTPDGKA